MSCLRTMALYFVHLDWHQGHYVKVLLDEIFGSDRFLNEIVWWYYNKYQGNINRFASNHDVIFWYSKSASYTFNRQKEVRDKPVRQIKRVWDKEKQAIVNAKDPVTGKVLYQESTERTIDDVWRLSMLQPADKTENVRYETQKPLTIAERIIATASNEGDLVADFFCGSGTALVAAEKLGRRWIGCDLGRFAIHTTRKRLLNIPDCRPFDIKNLGAYERQRWQIESGNGALRAYLDTILAFYNAEPVEGFIHLHGRKADRMVHVGATDAPVTIDETEDVMDEMADNGIEACDLLGWEWEMGLHDTISERARRRGLDLRPRQIPREVMERQVSEADAVRFFELAFVDLDVRRQGPGGVRGAQGLRDPERGSDPTEGPREHRVVVGSHRLLVGGLRLQRRGLPQPVAGVPDAREPGARDPERLARVSEARQLRDRREDHRHLRQRHDQARRGSHQVSPEEPAAPPSDPVRRSRAAQAQRRHLRRQRGAGARRRLARAGLSGSLGDLSPAARASGSPTSTAPRTVSLSGSTSASARPLRRSST